MDTLEVYMTTDASKGFQDTWRFLDRRIDNAISLEHYSKMVRKSILDCVHDLVINNQFYLGRSYNSIDWKRSFISYCRSIQQEMIACNFTSMDFIVGKQDINGHCTKILLIFRFYAVVVGRCDQFKLVHERSFSIFAFIFAIYSIQQSLQWINSFFVVLLQSVQNLKRVQLFQEQDLHLSHEDFQRLQM